MWPPKAGHSCKAQGVVRVGSKVILPSPSLLSRPKPSPSSPLWGKAQPFTWCFCPSLFGSSSPLSTPWPEDFPNPTCVLLHSRGKPIGAAPLGPDVMVVPTAAIPQLPEAGQGDAVLNIQVAQVRQLGVQQNARIP